MNPKIPWSILLESYGRIMKRYVLECWSNRFDSCHFCLSRPLLISSFQWVEMLYFKNIGSYFSYINGQTIVIVRLVQSHGLFFLLVSFFPTLFSLYLMSFHSILLSKKVLLYFTLFDSPSENNPLISKTISLLSTPRSSFQKKSTMSYFF